MMKTSGRDGLACSTVESTLERSLRVTMDIVAQTMDPHAPSVRRYCCLELNAMTLRLTWLVAAVVRTTLLQ